MEVEFIDTNSNHIFISAISERETDEIYVDEKLKI